MQEDFAVFVGLLKACVKRKDLQEGIRIHGHIAKIGLLDRNPFVGSSLVSMYSKCGSLAKAQDVCDGLLVRDVVIWNALIGGCVQCGHGERALNFFQQMLLEGLSPDVVTFICTLKACASIGAAPKGQEIHAEIVRDRWLEKHIFIGTALVDMYAKCGMLVYAEEVFNKLQARDAALWNTIITGYTEHGHNKQALSCYKRMRSEGLALSNVTFVCMLKACSSMEDANEGQIIHSEIAREGLPEEGTVGNALVDMYAKCGLLAEASEVFHDLPVQDIVSWTALIAGYAHHSCSEEAIYCYEQMQQEGHFPDGITFVFMLKACGNIGAACKGEQVHGEIIKSGLMVKDEFIVSALVDMYVKCGLLEKAEDVFYKLRMGDVVLWNALIAGYALLGMADSVFCLFKKLIESGVKLNLATLTGVLNACCHTGLLYEGQIWFEIMTLRFEVVPSLEHYTCMIDMFGRAGVIQRAMSTIEKMHFSCDLSVWHTVLNACRKCSNIKLGKLAFQHATQLDEKNIAAYICTSNVLCEAFMEQR